jgi:hypothetical protein
MQVYGYISPSTLFCQSHIVNNNDVIFQMAVTMATGGVGGLQRDGFRGFGVAWPVGYNMCVIG